MINGVIIKNLNTHQDDRGFFRELIKSNEDIAIDSFAQFSHCLVNQGVLKAWHIHKRQVEWVYVSGGVIKLALYDTRRDSSTYGKIMELYLGDGFTPIFVCIPPNVAHGVKCLKGPANMFYIASKTYDPLDEGRILFDDPQIGYDWTKD